MLHWLFYDFNLTVKVSVEDFAGRKEISKSDVVRLASTSTCDKREDRG